MAIPISKRSVSGSQPPHLSKGKESGDEFLDQEFEAAKEAEAEILNDKTKNEQRTINPPIQPEFSATNYRDNQIESMIDDLPKFKGTKTFRPKVLDRPIYNAMLAECVVCTQYQPDDTFFINLGLDVLALLHESSPEIRNELEKLKTNIHSKFKDKEKEQELENFFLSIFKKHIK
jgi:hypothetical protein